MILTHFELNNDDDDGTHTHLIDTDEKSKVTHNNCADCVKRASHFQTTADGGQKV